MRPLAALLALRLLPPARAAPARTPRRRQARLACPDPPPQQGRQVPGPESRSAPCTGAVLRRSNRPPGDDLPVRAAARTRLLPRRTFVPRTAESQRRKAWPPSMIVLLAIRIPSVGERS